jgi:hypothetical protein
MSTQYKQAYALVITSDRNWTRDEHHSLQEYLEHLLHITNAFTPYESFIDSRYSDDMVPSDLLIHPSITLTRVNEAVERTFSTLDNPGFCLHCGEEAFDSEPDAEKDECELCHHREVYGAAQILLIGAYHHDTR